MLRALLFVAVTLITAALAAPRPGQAAPPETADRMAIETVISKQLDAFQRDDAEGAFAFASPMIREKFGTAEQFLNMVQRGYRAVYRAQGVEFRQLAEARGRLAQHVFLIGPDGRAVVAVYFMEQQDDGTWRIDGVHIAPASDKAV